MKRESLAATGLSASVEVERVIGRVFVACRAGQLALSALMVANDRRRYRRPVLEAGVLAAAVGQSAWLTHRILRRGGYQDRFGLWVDTLGSAVGLIGCQAGLGDGAAPWMKNVAIGAALGAASAEESSPGTGAMAVLAAAALVTGLRAGGRDRAVAGGALAFNDAVSWAGMHVVARIYVGAYRRSAVLRDAAEERAVDRASRAAGEAERRRQHQRLHQGTIEVLSALASCEDVSAGAALARQEARRLRYALRTRGEVPGQLDEALYQVVESVRDSGLVVELVAAELETSPTDDVVAVLREAVLVSLVASREFAAADRATVRARSDAGSIIVSVRAHHGGFVAGHGSAHESSLRALAHNLRSVGGEADIWSAPERGTRVTFRVPAHAGSTLQGSGDEAVEGDPHLRVGNPATRDHHDPFGHGHIERRRRWRLVGTAQRQIHATAGDKLDQRLAGEAFEPSAQKGDISFDARRRESHLISVPATAGAVMGISAPLADVDERRRAERVIISAFLAWRVTGLATGAAALVGGWRHYRRAWLAALQLIGAGAESLWLAKRLLGAEGKWADTPAAAVDAATATAALAAGWSSLTPANRWTWLDWVPWSLSANVVAGQAMGVESAPLGALGATALIGLNAAATKAKTEAVAVSGGMAAFFAVGRLFAAQIRKTATDLEAAQAAAVRSRMTLAAENEKLVQLRILHDGAVQTLEALGSGRFQSHEAMRQYARTEADRLLGALELSSADHRDLRSELESVVARHLRAGLSARFQAEICSEPPGLVRSALCDAASEALTNVKKHAGVASAVVSLKVPPGDPMGIVVRVEDDGLGFDTTAQSEGFGITESIRHRVGDVGGSASIESSPGNGTRVTLVWPK